MRQQGAACRFGLLVLAVTVSNDVTSVIANILKLPFFLDTWATSAGVMIGGLAVGVCGGALYDLLMAFSYWTPAAAVFSLDSMLVAVLTWVSWRSGWVDIEKPLRLVAVGAVTGVLNAGLATTIGTPDLESTAINTQLFRQMLESEIGSSRTTALLETLLIEITDKTVSIFVAAAVLVLLQERFRWARPANGASEGDEA